ncbi:MAG: hypothetical protein ACREF4_07535 [Gammaproteobacteria bacterium]
MRELIGNRGRATQAGMAAVLLLVIVVMGSLYALLSGVNTATAELQQKRDDVTTVALKQAKEALIAWSAISASQGPGHLPCPDRDNDGDSEGAACGTPATRIGRLPWRTLGLPDLRDASGERLWYVVSGNFVNQVGNPVNSDTQGQLNVVGVAPANNVIAIVFAPGPGVGGQNRSGPVAPPATSVCNPATDNNCRVQNYLEGENGDAANDLFVAARRCEQTDCPGGAFNDQFVTITHQELFDAVENVVARRLETEIAPEIQAYVAAWGIHPFAAPFDDLTAAPPVGPPTTPDRPQSMYFGRDGHINGLLPVAYDVRWTKGLQNGWVGWQAGAFAAAKIAGLGDFVPPLTPPTCAWQLINDLDPDPDLDDRRWVCTFTYDGGAMSATVGGTLTNVARSLALPFNSAAAFAVTVSDGSGPLPPPPVIGLTNARQGTGHANVGFVLNLPAPPAGPATVTITFPAPRFSPAVDPANATVGWFSANQWYRLSYYSVTDGCRLGGVGGCTQGVTVQGVGGPPAARSVLVLAGRNLAGGGRAWAIANYFELENASSPVFNEADPAPPSFSVFARALRSPLFNDRVAVVAP